MWHKASSRPHSASALPVYPMNKARRVRALLRLVATPACLAGTPTGTGDS